MKKLLFVLIGVLLFSQNYLFGQGLKIKSPAPETVGIDLTFLSPSFENASELSMFSGIYQLDLSIPFNEKLNILAGMPFSTWAANAGETESSIGNLFIGAQTRSTDSTGMRPSAIFGVFLPTAPEEENISAVFAWLTDYYNQHRYLPNIITIVASGTWLDAVEKSGFWGFEFGTRIFIPTKSDNDDLEIVLNYGATGGGDLDPVILSVELVGQFLLSSESDSFSDKFYHTLSFGAGWTRGPFKPTLFYSLYLEEFFTSYVKGVLGVRMRYILP